MPVEQPVTAKDSRLFAIPRYVLRSSGRGIGPKVQQNASKEECTAIYGFSGKPHYDRFIANSKEPVTPYPLVIRFLQNQIAASDTSLQLIVIDADGPREPVVQAATMQAVLESFAKPLDPLVATHRLVLQPKSGLYMVEDESATTPSA